MHLIGDYHTHTKYSDGRGTVAQMMEAAQAIGLQQLGISDHGPKNIGTGVQSQSTYQAIRADIEQLAPKFPELEVKVGAEADIVGLAGEIDLTAETIKSLDYLIIGLHPYVMPESLLEAGWDLVGMNQVAKLSHTAKDKVRTSNTKTLVEALAKHDVQIVSHPNLGMAIDVAEVAQACAKYEVAYEINTGHEYQTVEEIKLAAKQGPDFIINTDAHYPASVGKADFGLRLVRQAGLELERVLNVVDKGE